MAAICDLWNADLNAISFVADNGGRCFVHRGAIRTMMKGSVDEQECVRFFSLHVRALRDAARRKIDRKRYPANYSFHLTSRDIRRELAAPQGMSFRPL